MMSDFSGEGVKNGRKSSDIIYGRSLEVKYNSSCTKDYKLIP